MTTSTEALARLREGNDRFACSTPAEADCHQRAVRHQDLSDGQQPFAVILGCSDSRVPAEIVFDQGLGELFVIRVAGNVAAPSQIGSVEFSVTKFGTPLVVVLGHTGCGAVTATLDELQTPQNNRSPNLAAIVDRIRPAIKPLLADTSRSDHEQLLEQAVKENVHSSVDALSNGSSILKELIDSQKIAIVGAVYNLKTGKVSFLDET